LGFSSFAAADAKPSAINSCFSAFSVKATGQMVIESA
jgi:hypothetical protein